VIDFAHPPEVEELAARTRAFVADVCIPREHEALDDELRAELQAAARSAGVFGPHVPAEYGGHGLDIRGWTAVFEEAGYSPLGPHALNCAAPDEGNMRMLEAIATAEQRERYLRPLAEGRVRSCFAMTEPHPGAGSDPAMLRTTARRVDGGWRIDGEKRFISGAEGAAFAICMARTGERIDRDEGATMFLVDAGNPGFRVGRRIPTMDTIFAAGHSELVLEGCAVPDEAVLGEVGLGYRYAQVRLGPARLTHCMRWLGLARRSLDVALARAAEREAFGQRLEELGMVQQLVADSVIDLETSRALNRWAAWALDSGGSGRHETSVAKVHVAEAVNRVVDRAIQICGGDGVSGDLPLARFLGEVRPFRIYDGPSETHRMAIARRATRNRARDRGA
jgi:acyl-CoA dehydrogenase